MFLLRPKTCVTAGQLSASRADVSVISLRAVRTPDGMKKIGIALCRFQEIVDVCTCVYYVYIYIYVCVISV